jgi:hypothetical protein
MRTIQRQLETLAEYYELDRDESTKPYRYSWKPYAKGLSLPGLSPQESLLLILAEKHLSALLPTKLMKSMEGFFTQAHSQMEGKSAAMRDREWLEKVRVVSTSQPLLPAKFDGYDNERSLALHRIISARASTLPFDRPRDFDLKQYDDDGRFGYGNGERVRLQFRIDKEAGLHLLESPLSADQKVKELEDEYEITATVVDSAMLDWWL